MNKESNIKRRVTATKRRGARDGIISNGVSSHRQLDPYEADKVRTSKHSHLKRESQQGERPNTRLAEVDHLDQEKVFFLFLAVFGALLLAAACFTYSVVFEKGNYGAISRIVGFLGLFPDKSSNYHQFSHPTFHSINPHTKFQEKIPTYFGEAFGETQMIRPLKLNDTIVEEANERDFGGLKSLFGESLSIGTMRQIKQDPSRILSDFRDYRIVSRDDDQDNYYAFDDDYLRDPFTNSGEDAGYEDYYGEDYYGTKNSYYDYKAVEKNKDEKVDKSYCRRTSEHRLYFPNCNTFHEIPALECEGTSIGEGTYRQAFRIKVSFAQDRETIVVKDIHLDNNLAYDAYEYTRMDAIVAERLTASPRIYRIYGTCGIGIMSEYFPHGQIEEIAVPEDINTSSLVLDEGPLICYNDLSGLKKLQISLHMAEALAEIHGYRGGPIVHQDVKLDQFFFNADKSEVILNDFNRAEFMLWDHREEAYCKYKEGYGAGNWRSPEEYFDEYLNEKVDVYSLGNNMYSLLTGLWVFNDEPDFGEVQYLVRQGKKPYIDPRYKERSLAESKLVEIIGKCHEYYEEERPSIFEVVEFLRESLEEVHGAMDGNKEHSSVHD